MSLIEKVRKDLLCVGAYIQSLDPSIRANARDRQVVAIKSRIEALNGTPVSLEHATGLQDALKSGKWPQASLVELQHAIDNLASGQSSASGVRRAVVGGAILRRSYQYCIYFQNMLTEKEWTSLKSTAMKSAKVSQIAARAWSLGITVPAEKTSWAIAEVLCFCHSISDQDEQQKVYDDIKSAVKELSQKRLYPHGHLLQYPADPKDLPKEMYDFAYPSPDDAPTPATESVFGVMRGCKKRLMPSKGEELQLLKKFAAKAGLQVVTKNTPPASPPSGSPGSGSREFASPSLGMSALSFKPLLALPGFMGHADPGHAAAAAPRGGTESTTEAFESGLKRRLVGKGAAVRARGDEQAESDGGETPPRGAGRGRGEGAVATKRPAGRGWGTAAAKRPAPQGAGGGRPALPKLTSGIQMPPVYYKKCKISVSWPREGFRVFLDLSQANPIDTQLLWKFFGSRNEAWNAALDLIDNKGKG